MKNNLTLLMTFFILCTASVMLDDSATAQIQGEITPYIQKALLEKSIKLNSLKECQTYYKKNNYAPLWINQEELTDASKILINTIRNAPAEGLRPADYQISDIDRIVSENNGPTLSTQKMAYLDIYLTDAYLTYTQHLTCGKINPAELNIRYSGKEKTFDSRSYLEQAFAEKTLQISLEELSPKVMDYQPLKESLATYQTIEKAGGWPPIKTTRLLAAGVSDNDVGQLRKRLKIEGYTDHSVVSTENYFDSSLVALVKAYQLQNGLEADGKVGKDTRLELNVPIASRIKQIELNLERLRWLNHNLHEKRVIINIPGFDLSVFAAKKFVLTMNVIVGKQALPTPMFDALITYIVINPYWNVPDSIAKKELLPLIKKKPGYLEQERLRIFQGYGNKMTEINPGSINWERVTSANFNYWIRQEPGEINSLGRIMFRFPNQYDVYLHDTPFRTIFSSCVRAFSHGCIRVEHPLELAQYLLQDNDKETIEALKKIIDEGLPRTLTLKKSVPIYIVYRTAWVDPSGKLQFRRDIYGQDRKLKTLFYK